MVLKLIRLLVKILSQSELWFKSYDCFQAFSAAFDRCSFILRTKYTLKLCHFENIESLTFHKIEKLNIKYQKKLIYSI